MFHSRDHSSPGQAGMQLSAACPLVEKEDKAYLEPVRSEMTTKTPDAAHDLDEVGHAVVPRTIPSFWEPVEEWRLD